MGRWCRWSIFYGILQNVMEDTLYDWNDLSSEAEYFMISKYNPEARPHIIIMMDDLFLTVLRFLCFCFICSKNMPMMDVFSFDPFLLLFHVNFQYYFYDASVSVCQRIQFLVFCDVYIFLHLWRQNDAIDMQYFT